MLRLTDAPETPIPNRAPRPGTVSEPGPHPCPESFPAHPIPTPMSVIKADPRVSFWGADSLQTAVPGQVLFFCLFFTFSAVPPY